MRPLETPLAVDQGVSVRRDRMWGWIGAILGVAVGVGSAGIAILVEGASLYQSSPYPPFFTTRRLLAYDLFLAAVIVVGGIFAIFGIVLARRSRFPRTDAMGGALVGTILLLLGAALVFTRLVAVIRGS